MILVLRVLWSPWRINRSTVESNRHIDAFSWIIFIRIRRTWTAQDRGPGTALQSLPFLFDDLLSSLTWCAPYMPASLGLQVRIVSSTSIKCYELLPLRIDYIELLTLWTSCIASKVPKTVSRRVATRNEGKPYTIVLGPGSPRTLRCARIEIVPVLSPEYSE